MKKEIFIVVLRDRDDRYCILYCLINVMGTESRTQRGHDVDWQKESPPPPPYP